MRLNTPAWTIRPCVENDCNCVDVEGGCRSWDVIMDSNLDMHCVQSWSEDWILSMRVVETGSEIRGTVETFVCLPAPMTSTRISRTR